MKKKTALAAALIILASLPLHATLGEEFVLLHKANILPVDSKVGQTVDPRYDETCRNILNALSVPFTEQWAEYNVADGTRKALVNMHSPLLASIMPMADLVFSRTTDAGEGLTSVRVRSLSKGFCATFVLENGRILDIALR